ncbi:MAG: respiratory nitrate reductase subunit gamma [Parvularculaceae bacterium]
MTQFLWGVYPYICFTLFFAVPIIRMIFRPYAWTTRASGLFNNRLLGVASLLFHWGILLVLFGHIAGWLGGLQGNQRWVAAFYWLALIGGVMTIAGSATAFLRRLFVAEVRAMSQPDDYIVHLFLIPILSLGLYQVIVQRIFGVAYTAAPWFASIWTFSPQPELLASAGLVAKLHIFLALTFFAYFPFTKLVHFWALPINYFVRPYQSMRTAKSWILRKWEFALRSDRSYMLYASAFVIVAAIGLSLSPFRPVQDGFATPADAAADRLAGYPLYVSQCARCHGLDGEGDGPGAKSPLFAQPPRDLTAGRYRFISTDNGVASDADLYHTLTDGLEPAGMPAFDQLTHDQRTALVDTLNRFWKDRPAPGRTITPGPRPAASSETLATGADLFASACAMCHGPQGRGDGDAAATIVDAVGNSVPPANLARARLKAGRDPEQIYLRIACGIPGGGGVWLMPPFGYLTNEEIWAIVDYLETEIFPREFADARKR